MADVLPIYANADVHVFYSKQKSEFHFQQKTDNEFLMFLLDTAVRVISIVQHLAPVIEAVSDASADNEEDEEFSEQEFNTDGVLTGVTSTVMEVDTLADAVLDSVKIPPPAKVRPNPEPSPANAISDQLIAQQVQQLIDTPTTLPTVQQTPALTTPQYQVTDTYQPPSEQSLPSIALSNPQPTVTRSQPSPQQQSTPQPSTPAQQSTSTPQQQTSNLPESSRRSSRALPEPSEIVKEEKPVPEVIEIKEETDEAAQAASSHSTHSLLSPQAIQQLMTSVQNNEENVRIQNFVPTAQPSNLPPSFLDKNNPLSMLSLSGTAPALPTSSYPFANLSTDSLPGGSGLLAKDDKSKDIKGNSSNPILYQAACPHCGQKFSGAWPVDRSIKRHINSVHLGVKRFGCRVCKKRFTTSYCAVSHMKQQHGLENPEVLEFSK